MLPLLIVHVIMHGLAVPNPPSVAIARSIPEAFDAKEATKEMRKVT
jgi:hypothetical protein